MGKGEKGGGGRNIAGVPHSFRTFYSLYLSSVIKLPPPPPPPPHPHRSTKAIFDLVPSVACSYNFLIDILTQRLEEGRNKVKIY